MLFRRSIFSIITGLILFSVYSTEAGVTGQCSNCHTMHNSQAGAALAFYYNEPTKALVTESPTPNPGLLVSDCVGCHTSSSSTETIKILGSSRIPIVLNTSEPLAYLAGGNFYWVAQGPANDNYGHNVWGISAKDSNLSRAPGDGSTCVKSCHESLATDPAVIDPFYGIGGCKGCHQSTKHHSSSPPSGSLETAASGWYRFLSGHWSGTTVNGVEDIDWEQNPSAGHNKYQGVTYSYWGIPGDSLDITHSMTGYCQGCHLRFHSAMNFGGSMVSPWFKHPSDAALPTTGEYSAYDPVTNYNTRIPVAWVNPETPAAGEAVVMCLTCHRAHGSQYPNMLRWDYKNWPPGDPLNPPGCIVCHSTKN
jgi:predicted CXXCH cytochrome family protein